MTWETEKVYYQKDQYFEDAFADIQQSRRSVEVETYIWEPGLIGSRFVEELSAAALRGVNVRFIVDSFGTLLDLSKLAEGFADSRARVKVYHSLYIWRVFTSRFFRLSHLFKFFSRLNKRLHRKMVVIDGRIAYVGGFNLLDAVDRDTGVRITGDMSVLEAAFEKIWGKPRRIAENRLLHPLVRLNATRRLRQRKNLDLVRHITHARHRIWITNAYFVPPLFLLKAIFTARKHGVDVRLMVSSRPDHLFMKWMMKTYYRSLLRHGVRIFEYQCRFLHAKTLIVDDWVTVGSSNLNHRSLIHDLEIDIVLAKEESRQSLIAQFFVDQNDAVEIFESDVKGTIYFTWILDFVVRIVRYWV